MCVLGKFKSHRVSVDCLWQSMLCMCVRVCMNTCVYVLVTLWVTRVFPHSCQL